MTLEEHEMLMLMFAKHAQAMNILVEILKSRGVVEQDDVAAFHVAFTADSSSSEALLRHTAKAYLKAAKASQAILPPKTGDTLL
jgi:hypothetical protein